MSLHCSIAILLYCSIEVINSIDNRTVEQFYNQQLTIMGFFYSKPKLRRVSRGLDTKREIKEVNQKIKTLSPKEKKAVRDSLGKVKRYGITRQELRGTLKDLRKQKKISLVDKRNIEKKILGGNKLTRQQGSKK